MNITPRAYRTARIWAAGRGTVAQAVIDGIAQQAQDHLDHGADPEYLDDVATWMRAEQPTWQDLDLAMRFASAPKPQRVAYGGHPCACRGGTAAAGGAPAPAIVRQLIRRHRPARAA
ncbi:MAG: hypothetical protein HOY76_08415 [Streptomyces sp.]|nr:hypothetical protein [Streptomyces sp.]